MEAASEKYKSYGVEKVEETFTEFETANLSTYSLMDENFDFTLAAALWIKSSISDALEEKAAGGFSRSKRQGAPGHRQMQMLQTALTQTP